jgi:tyrosine/nicotianamine family aminotransferase
MYCDSLRPIDEYKKLEEKLTCFANSSTNWGFDGPGADVSAGRDKWIALRERYGDPVTGPADPIDYVSANQDIVEQLLVGGGFRIVGSHTGPATRSVVVTSSDPAGVKFVITAHNQYRLDELAAKAESIEEEGALSHFDASKLALYTSRHARQGVALLGFSVASGDIERIHANYEQLHPKLLVPGGQRQYGSTKVLEVYAYYVGEKSVSEADTGTVIRFVEEGDDGDVWVLPGVEKVEAAFDNSSVPAYCDHWVSNVNSRTGFLDTLNDTLGFSPKVDFNAGVVAAGEAQIESTVTGNSPGTSTTNKEMALKDQSQIYLPINNALSEVGHVHHFLKQLGQGVQHVASRVDDLPIFIQRANDYRKMTGAGLTFLGIPPSYYGHLTAKRLARDADCDADAAGRIHGAMRRAGIVDEKDIVDLHVTRDMVVEAMPKGMPTDMVDHVLRGRYNNLYDLLRDQCSEELYLRIVRNKILVDIQGEDMLLQIFTSSILQRRAGEEAPFLEFIQRVCSECLDEHGKPKPIRPGCGGFGIRNFLTLFLSIEASAATEARAAAELAGDAAGVAFHSRMVDIFVQQLDESNPILTTISDAMTAEGLAVENGDAEAAQRWAGVKNEGQQKLMEVSTKYKNTVKKLRLDRQAASSPRKWNVRVGKRAAGIENPIRKIMDTLAGKANPNKDIVSLAQGDPTVFPHLAPSKDMVNAALNVITRGMDNGYQPSQGNTAARSAIAKAFTVPGRPPVDANDIFMTHGCSEALSQCVAALAAEGSNMLLPRPGFPLCEVLCEYHGVEPRFYDLDPEKGWEINIDSIAALADENTCGLVVNNPSNPCGSVYSREHLSDVLAKAEELRLPIIADEVYTGMSFGNTFVSCAAVTPRVPILSVCALSKRWVVPGWRCGWITVHDTDNILKNAGIQDTLLKICQITLGPAAPIQAAIPEILSGGPAEEEWKSRMLSSLADSAKYCMKRCSTVKGLEVASDPQGAMYIMVKIEPNAFKDLNGSIEFAGALLSEESVVILPGECFAYPGFFRVVFCGNLQSLEEAWDRIEAFCNRRYIEPTSR